MKRIRPISMLISILRHLLAGHGQGNLATADSSGRIRRNALLRAAIEEMNPKMN